MKKINNYIIISLIIIAGCTTKKEVLNKKINHSFYKLSFEPKEAVDSINGIQIAVMPVDAKSINEISFKASKRDGNYEKEFVSVQKKLKSNKKDTKYLSKQEKDFKKGIINGFNAINTLKDKKVFPDIISYQLKDRLLYGEEKGHTGTEVELLSNKNYYPDKFNPYKLNDNYLSVFRIDIENNGNKIEKVLLKKFQVLCGNELLYPLDNNFLKENLKENTEKISNIYRLNMPNELIITPSQKITKYIATPALNPDNNSLNVQYINDDVVKSFNFKLNKNIINKDYDLELFILEPVIKPSAFRYRFYYCLSFDNSFEYTLKNSSIFLNDKMKRKNATIYAIAINITESTVKYGKVDNIRFIEGENNRIQIQFYDIN